MDSIKDQLDQEETKRVQERDRANRARSILSDPLFTEAWEAVENRLMDELKNAPLSGMEEVNNLRRCLKLLTKVRSVIEVHIETGKMAEVQLTDIEEKRKRLGIFRKVRSAA